MRYYLEFAPALDRWHRRVKMRMYAVFMVLALGPACSARLTVNVTALGAHADGTDSVATTAAFQKAFASDPEAEITVPPGSYLIDNADGPLTITNFSGRLVFQGNAKLIFTTNTNGGLLFVGGSGAIITGLRATYATPPSVRKSPNEELKFSRTSDTILTDTVVENSPAAGILFYGSTNPSVTNATVLNSLADGLNFSNCQDARVTHLLTYNTGDDGLAFVNYDDSPNLVGGVAEDIVINNSKARGIAIAGQSNVTVNGFHIQNTSSSGLLVAKDTANHSRIPSRVLIANGDIFNAGTLEPLVGNQYGIEFNSQGSVTFRNIAVFRSGNSGLSGTAPNGTVTVNNVSVNSPLRGLGFLFFRTQVVEVTESIADNTPSYGLLSLESNKVTVTGLTVMNAGGRDPLKRAVWFEDTHEISAYSIHIVSDVGTAGTIGCYTHQEYAPSSGSVKALDFTVNGKPSVENSCPNVSFTP
jgi:hypothetical protein